MDTQPIAMDPGTVRPEIGTDRLASQYRGMRVATIVPGIAAGLLALPTMPGA